MNQRRWQPPPMHTESPSEHASSGSHPLDVGVVRKILAVNPDLRKGRTTVQVKRALEQGEALSATGTPQGRGEAQRHESMIPARAPNAPARVAGLPARGPAAGAASELSETLDFFVRGKAERLAAQERELATRRRALDEEEQRARRELCDQLVRFVAMLDEATVALHGRAALARHAELLARLGTTAVAVLEQAQKARVR